MVVEGVPEIGRALTAGLEPRTLCLLADHPEVEALARDAAAAVEWVDAGVAAAISYGERVSAAVGIFPEPSSTLEALPRPPIERYLVLVDVEKPGNLGAIVRTARAAGMTGVLVTGSGTDPYHANVIRASRGHVFGLPLAVAEAEPMRAFLRERGVRILAAAVTGGSPYWEEDLSQSHAFVLGAEDRGLPESWLAAADGRVWIPMEPAVDSLNVSVTAALLAYESRRQAR